MNPLPPGTDTSKIPLMPNPSGGPPDFVNPSNLLDAQTGTGITLIIISLLFLACRLFTNLKLSQKLCLDDYLCIFAKVGGIAYWSLMHTVAVWGISRHAWDVPVSVFTDSMTKGQAAIQFIIPPTMWAAKASVLALYIRMFGRIRWLRITCYVWMLLMALFYGMNFVIAGVYCIPRPGESWEAAAFMRRRASAWSAVVIGVFSCLADLVILVLPFPVILQLKLNSAKKMSLGIVFATALFLVALSMVSLYVRYRLFSGFDPTWYNTSLGMITVAEVFGTIMVSCAPALSAFWSKIFAQSTFWSRVKFSCDQSTRKSSQSTLAPSRLSTSTSIIKETEWEVRTSVSPAQFESQKSSSSLESMNAKF